MARARVIRLLTWRGLWVLGVVGLVIALTNPLLPQGEVAAQAIGVAPLETSSQYENPVGGFDTPDSPFGPHRTSPDYGIPRHAYSPFDNAEEPGPQGEFIDGQVLIKFEGEVLSPRMGTTGPMASTQTLVDGISTKYGITGLERVFPTDRTPNGPEGRFPGRGAPTRAGPLVSGSTCRRS